MSCYSFEGVTTLTWHTDALGYSPQSSDQLMSSSLGLTVTISLSLQEVKITTHRTSLTATRCRESRTAVLERN